MSRKCWARELGGCDSLSREHIISNSVLRQTGQQTITSKGVVRLPDGTWAHDALTSKILCGRHNAELSPLDEEAGRLADWLMRTNDSSFTGSVTLDGSKIERWIVKHIVNSLAAGWGGKPKTPPDLDVINTVFGMAPIPDGCGLYVVNSTYQSTNTPFQLKLDTVHGIQPEGSPLIGGFVSLNGLVLFYAFNSNAVDLIRKYGYKFDGHEVSHAPFNYRPEQIFVNHSNQGLAAITLTWPLDAENMDPKKPLPNPM